MAQEEPLHFPTKGLLPKVETQAAAFLEKFPEHDGRGVKIAILDTGVDPGAAGLQKTTAGSAKIVDIVDCSGSGDVDTSSVVKAEDGRMQGLSGRTLTLNATWKNPSGEWHLGVKRIYELYPDKLKSRVETNRKKKWTIKHRKVEAALHSEMTIWKQSHPKPTVQEDIDDLADWEARVSTLAELEKNWEDAGPLYDIIVWHTGQEWQAVVDTSEEGDLRQTDPITNYHVRHEWRTFDSKHAHFNYCLNIYDDGQICSIVVDAGSHGTHVAGIAAAHHPDNPDLNGLAPGAEIISLKVGDSRLAGMETGTSISRALTEVVRHKCDIINMSYGEAVAINQTGRIMQMVEEITNKYGVIFVLSASNSGPALSTVGAPGGNGTSPIAAAAYLSKDMMLACYSLRTSYEGSNFTWSSVGPCYDGELGPTILAPGGAITSVPNWTLQRSMLMNGTSMASPNACGGIALLLSALKANSIPYTPHLIRRAITTAAIPQPKLHPLVQGHGMLAIYDTYTYLTTHHKKPYLNLPLQVKVQGIKKGRGIYLREPGETAVCREFQITIEPAFHDDTPSEDMVGYQRQFTLSLSDTQAGKWVTIPSYLLLVNGGRSFAVTVDGSALSPGLWFAKILGRDVEYPEAGPSFEVPITLLKAIEGKTKGRAEVLHLGRKELRSGEICRDFVAVPQGASWMAVTLVDRRAEIEIGEGNGAKEEMQNTKTVVLHTMQLLPETPYRNTGWEKYVPLVKGGREIFDISVQHGRLVEVTTALYATSEGRAAFDVSVEFRGLRPETEEITLLGSESLRQINVEAAVRDEELEVKAKLNRWQQQVVPVNSVIKPLGSRDVLADGRQVYELMLEYKFHCETGGEEVKVVCPFLQGILYESPFEAQFFFVFDGHRKQLGCGDAWPSAIKCAKGENLVRLQVRHDERGLLEKLVGLVVSVERGLKGSKEVNVPVYRTREGAMLGEARDTGISTWVRKGCMTCVWFVQPERSKLPKGVQVGDMLLGDVTYEKMRRAEPGKSKRPKGFLLKYVVGPERKDKEEMSAEKVSPADERGEEEKIRDKVRDVWIEGLARIGDDTVFGEMYERLKGEYPNCLLLVLAKLRWLDDEKRRQTRLSEITQVADEVVGLVDEQEVALCFGVNVNQRDPQALRRQEEMETKRGALAEAYAKKIRALIDNSEQGKGHGMDESEKSSDLDTERSGKGKAAPREDKVRQVLAELAKWDNLEDAKYARLVLARDEGWGRLGLVMKLLCKLIVEGAQGSGLDKAELHERRIQLMQRLGWMHMIENEKKWQVIDCPKSYSPFCKSIPAFLPRLQCPSPYKAVI